MNTFSTQREIGVFDELKQRLYAQKVLEENSARIKTKDGELEELLDIIESNYTFNLFKLDEVAELDEKSQRKFIESKLYIEDTDISEKAKLQVILTTACILNRVDTRAQELDVEKMNLLATFMVPIDIEDYPIYGDILSSPVLLQAVIDKTEDIDERLDLCDQIIDYCDIFAYEKMDSSEYKKACYDTIEMVNEKQVKTSSKTRMQI